MPETGSFGKSRRRSRSKSSGVPTKKEALSQQAADEVFTNFLSSHAKTRAQSPARKQSISSTTQAQVANVIPATEGNVGEATRYAHKEPTEVILRGFGHNQSYAAIKHYETLAGRICEDYPRDPPSEQRRYKSDLRSQTTIRSKPLSAEEKEKARRYAGGDHWIKVTFESADAAESALYTSPQSILGHLVYAEPYNGTAPTNINAIQAPRQGTAFAKDHIPPASLFTSRKDETQVSSSSTEEFISDKDHGMGHLQHEQDASSSRDSQASSSVTMDTATTSESSATIVPDTQQHDATQEEEEQSNSVYCRRIPTAKRATLLPAAQALLPQQTMTQRISSHIPLVSWLSRDVIGNQVPRTESGDFDWAIASFYWRLCWLLDFYFRLMNGELTGSAE